MQADTFSMQGEFREVVAVLDFTTRQEMNCRIFTDVKNFVKQKFFTVEIDCGNFVAVSERIDDENVAEKIAQACNGKNAVVTELKKEIKTSNPPKLFDLTALQREANKQFGYTAKQTLDALQHLYEAKLSTYPRTDSQYLTDDMEQTAVKIVSCVYQKFSEFDTRIPYLRQVRPLHHLHN